MNNLPFTTTTTVSDDISGTKRQKKHHHHHQHHPPVFLLKPLRPPPPPDSQMNYLPFTDTNNTTVSDAISDTETTQNDDEYRSLLPGLPDHIAQLCLHLVSPSLLFSVCKSWRRLIYSPSFPPFLSIYTLLLSTSPPPLAAPSPSPSPAPLLKKLKQPHLVNSVIFSSFDLISSTWESIPPPPLNLLLQHPSFINYIFPIQSVTVAGNLALLAATNIDHSDDFLPALTQPLIFSPSSKNWNYGPPSTVPRRYCVAGSSDGIVYMASGVGTRYKSEVARSAEKWDLKKSDGKIEGKKNNSRDRNWKWEKMKSMIDEKFSREDIDAIGWRGKLCMVNAKGRAGKEGIIYNIKDNAWEQMPDGMRLGWRGPAAAMEEENLFMVDQQKGILKKYDQKLDKWGDIYEHKLLKDAQNVAAARGRVCVVCSGRNSILVVDVTVVPPRVRVVETPPETKAIAIHILPRMSQEE